MLAAPRRRVRIARSVIAIGFAAATLAFLLWFSFTATAEPQLLLVWFVAFIPLLVAVHLPAWLLLGRLAIEPDPTQQLRDFVWAEAPIALVSIAGLVMLGGSWGTLHLFWLPTVPSLLAIAWVAATPDAAPAEPG